MQVTLWFFHLIHQYRKDPLVNELKRLQTAQFQVAKVDVRNQGETGDVLFQLTAPEPACSVEVTYRWDARQPVLRKLVTITNRSGQAWNRLLNVRLGTYATDAQADDEFAIITRVEAFIAGWGLDEAMRRAEAYHAAGSDGILIHSALSSATEVLAFQKEWAGRSPIVIVPTKYHATPTEVFREAGFSIAIWANQLLRAAVVAMQDTARTIHREQNLRSVEDRIAPVKELFRLHGASELQEAEERYLPKRQARSRALILAASRGSALGELTEHRPKTMVKIRGRPLLSHIVSAYNAAGIKRINVVRGYLPEAIDLPAISYADNPDYADTSELLSLACGLDSDPDDSMDLYVSYGDVIFKRYILDALAETEDNFAIVVDTEWHESVNRGRAADYVRCTQPHSRRAFYQQTWLESAAEDLPEDRIHGEWMGFLKVSAAALPRFRSLVAGLAAKPENRKAKLHQLLTELVRNGERVRVIYTTGHWLDIDSLEDVVAAGSFA